MASMPLEYVSSSVFEALVVLEFVSSSSFEASMASKNMLSSSFKASRTLTYASSPDGRAFVGKYTALNYFSSVSRFKEDRSGAYWESWD